MKTNVKIAMIGGITTVLAEVIPVIISYLLHDVKDEGVVIIGDHATIQKALTKEEKKAIVDGITERVGEKFKEMANDLNRKIEDVSAKLQQKERELAQKELELSQKERELAQKELEREQKRLEITKLLVEQGAKGLEVKKYKDASDNLSAILETIEGKKVRENMIRATLKKLSELEEEMRKEEFKTNIKLGEGWIKSLDG